ncbi:hypothetical protein Hoch_6676 [Haliangium ochraceum DSM 14365]|uniref:Uncharacterized protein n=1 Tax=Haliangium ochraceum (strain DSM 14365 / JCM 11303 / SMP-2) TaxID=502025 RepID=D0LT06_HALO1|nr:hypothetical protein Hoch_6676 [Haliangium ochraceum DSM 14365]
MGDDGGFQRKPGTGPAAGGTHTQKRRPTPGNVTLTSKLGRDAGRSRMPVRR